MAQLGSQAAKSSESSRKVEAKSQESSKSQLSCKKVAGKSQVKKKGREKYNRSLCTSSVARTYKTLACNHGYQQFLLCCRSFNSTLPLKLLVST